MQRILYTFILVIVFGSVLQAQTIIIDSTGAGGFESGADFTANGWTVVNSTGSANPTNKWAVGSVPTGFTGNTAYISNNGGAAWAYTNNNASVTHFYRDVTLPAGETNVTLSFKWKGQGESGFYDAMLVGFAPVSFTPEASATSLGNGLPAGITNIGSFWGSSASTNRAELKFSSSSLGNCNAPVTIRLIFTWKNDGSGGTTPPAAIDDISLITSGPSARLTAAGGTFTINNVLPNTGTNFTTFTEVIQSLNALLSCSAPTGQFTFNVEAGQTFQEILPALIVGGSAAFPIVFQKSGAGVNPKIQRTDGGTLSTSTLGGQGDAILTLQGGDYITVDGIDLAASNTGIEYGLLLRKNSGTDGCKNITFKNANVTLTRASSGTSYSTGIYISNLDANSAVSASTGVTVTNTGGRHENIIIKGNTISNVFCGVQARGYAHGSAPYNLYDSAVYIGHGGVGNAIGNFGGVSTNAAYGVYFLQVNDAVANYNTIDNMAGGGVASTGTIYGIYGNTGTTSTLTASNNNISLNSTYSTGAIYGVYNSGYTGNLNINSDTIALNHTGSTSGTVAHIYNASATAATQVSISNNLLRNSVFNSSGTCYAIYNSVTNASQTSVNNNVITGITKSGSSNFYVFYSLASPTGTETFANNKVFNISNSGGNLYGYYSNTAASHRHLVYGNAIYGLSCNGISYAIYKGSGISSIYRNKIYDITTTSAGSIVAGIYIVSGTKDSVFNNIIGDLKATAYSGANGISGIYSSSTSSSSTIGIYYNSIFLNAASTGTNFGTSGIFLTANATATTAAVELKNNLVVNNSTANGTGKTVVLRRSSTALNNFVSTSNNNLYFSSTGSIFNDGTNDDPDLAAYKVRVSPAETASVSEAPVFVSVNGTDPTYLNINTTTPTQIESGAAPLPGIADDFDGNARSATKPDIGAFEFAGTGVDLTAPNMVYTALGTKTICTDAKTISATITDISGVNAAPGTRPRLWFKKSSESDVLPASNTSAANGWKYVEASNSSSPFTFTFDFSLLTSPLVDGDSVSYFIVAQDLAPAHTVGANIATFSATPSSVALGASAFPVSGLINGFSILSQPTPIAVKVSTSTLCSSGSVTLDIDGVDVIGGEPQWQSSPASANAWTDIPGGTTLPYTTGAITASTDFRLILKCGGTPISSSPSPVLSVTVSGPQLISSTGASRCGPGTLNLTASADPGYEVLWYESATGGSPLQTGNAFTTPVLNSTQTYYAAAGSTAGGTSTAQVGAGASTSNTYPNPFYSLWSNTHNQYLIRGSELQSAGLTAGNITELALNITDPSTLPVIDLSVKMGTTAAMDMSSFVSTNFTTVFTSASLMPVTGVNTLTFSTPFYWDGSSNIVIEFCHGNPSSGATMNRVIKVDNTPFISTIHTHTSAGTGSSVQCGNLTANLTTYSIRPQFSFTQEARCVGVRVPVIATVTTPPAITKGASPAAICVGQSTNLTAGSSNAGYTFTWTPGGITGASINVSPVTTTKYYVSAVDNSGGTYNGCINLDSLTVDVNPVPSPLSVSPSPAAVCLGGSPVMLAATGGTLDNVYAFGTQAAQNGATSLATGYPAPFSVYYGGQRMQMLILASELSASGFTAGSTINSINFPVVSLGANWGGSMTACKNFQVRIGATTANSISAFASGLTQVVAPANFTPAVGYNNRQIFATPFTWDGTSNLIIETTFSNAITGGTGDVVVQYNSPTTYQSCIVYRSDGVTADAAASATSVNYSYNARPDFTLEGGSPTNITWSPVTNLYSDAAGTIAYAAGTPTDTVYARPVVNTTYTVVGASASGCSSSATVNVSVTIPPAAAISYGSLPYCNSGTATVTHTGSTGGTYSAPAGLSINPTTGAIDLAASTAGTYTVTYSIAASGGCGAFSTTADVTINAAPAAAIAYPGSPYCPAGSAAAVSHSGSMGGVYSSTPGLSVDPVTGTIDPAASVIGNYVVTYTIAASGGCPVYTATANVSIATLPSATISYPTGPFCTNAGTVMVNQTGSRGGTYSAPAGLSIDPATGTINLGASTPGSYTVTYSILAGSGCSAFSTTTSVSIVGGPSAVIAYPASPYCSGAGTATVVHTGTAGGTYIATPGLSLDPITGTINLATSTPGTYTVTYTVPASGSCLVYNTTTSVTISQRPAATITYAGSPYCINTSGATVTQTGTAGGTYSSTPGLDIDAATGAINIAASLVGNYTVTYTVPAANGCAAFSTTANISLVTPASATISYPASPYCSNGGTATVNLSGSTGGTFTSTAGLSINAATGAINLGATTPGTYIVTYTVPAATGCSALTTSATITVTAAPVATISYAGSPFCSSSGSTASVTRTGASGGTFSSTAGLAINPSTGAINIPGSTPGTYLVSYKVTGSGGCADYTATTNVVITQAPAATINYTASPYCSGAGIASVVQTGSTGGTYSSTVGLVINATTGEVDLAASVAGTYVVSYTIPAAGGCATYIAATTISITAIPSATISYPASPYCGNGATANVTQSGTGGGAYSSTAGLSINNTTGAINIGASTPGTYTVTYAIPAAGACGSFSTTTSVTITAPPSATISYAGSPYCGNAGTATVTRTGTAGGTYSAGAGLSINASTGAIDLAASTPGTYTVTYTIAASGGCATYSTTSQVTVSAAPSATISYTGSPYCGSTGVAVVTQTGTAGGTFSSLPGLSINATTGAVNIAASTPGAYTVTYSIPAANGCATYNATTILRLTTPGTWTGGSSTDWNTASNWCGGIPTAATDATIPASAPRMPVINNGTAAAKNIAVETGASITVGNGGVLELYGNMSGGGILNAANGNITLRGASNQAILPFTAGSLTMNMSSAGSSLLLGGNSSVTGALNLANGNITLGAYNLSLGSSSNGKPTAHIITNGTGNVIVSNLAVSQSRTVPVGSDATSYNPVALTANTGHVADNFSIKVQTGVFENGVSGATFQTHVADRTWIIREGTEGGSNVNIALQWSGAQERNSFDRAKSFISRYDGTGWTETALSPAIGNDPYTQTGTAVTSFGAFAVRTKPIPRPNSGIFPNPAKDYLNVVTDLLSTGPVVFSIVDSRGRVVYRRTETLAVGLNMTKLEIAHLSAGVYFVHVTTRLNDQFLVQKFVKVN